MIIGSAAHFVICACGAHGRIVTADGTPSIEFGSKEKARLALDDGVKKEMIADCEVGEVLRQINASSLLEREDGVSVELRLITAILSVATLVGLHGEETEPLPHGRHVN